MATEPSNTEPINDGLADLLAGLIDDPRWSLIVIERRIREWLADRDILARAADAEEIARLRNRYETEQQFYNEAEEQCGRLIEKVDAIDAEYVRAQERFSNRDHGISVLNDFMVAVKHILYPSPVTPESPARFSTRQMAVLFLNKPMTERIDIAKRLGAWESGDEIIPRDELSPLLLGRMRVFGLIDRLAVELGVTPESEKTERATEDFMGQPALNPRFGRSPVTPESEKANESFSRKAFIALRQSKAGFTPESETNR